MKLLYSSSSPYSAKALMAARYLGFEVEAIKVNTSEEPALLIAANPLGKIPTLITDEGKGIFDSRGITHYLHRLSGKKLYPSKDEKRTDAEVLEALCDGITDSLLEIVYEKRFRPTEFVYQPAMDKQWKKVVRGLDHLEANLPKIGKSLNGGHFSLAALLGYLMLRFPGEWENGRVGLAAWPAKFEKKFPAFAELRPSA